MWQLGRWSVGMVVIDLQLDLMILEVFSNLNDPVVTIPPNPCMFFSMPSSTSPLCSLKKSLLPSFPSSALHLLTNLSLHQGQIADEMFYSWILMAPYFIFKFCSVKNHVLQAASNFQVNIPLTAEFSLTRQWPLFLGHTHLLPHLTEGHRADSILSMSRLLTWDTYFLGGQYRCAESSLLHLILHLYYTGTSTPEECWSVFHANKTTNIVKDHNPRKCDCLSRTTFQRAIKSSSCGSWICVSSKAICVSQFSHSSSRNNCPLQPSIIWPKSTFPEGKLLG